MNTTAIPDFRASTLFLRAEEHGAPENALERIGKAIVMRPVERQSPLVQDLRCAPEMHHRILLAYRDCRKPKEHQSVLTERNAVIWMADDLQKELAIASSVGHH